ncbi:MAG: YopX family protein [Patescibacteria group bacterium]
MDKIKYKTWHKKQKKISKVNYFFNGSSSDLQYLRPTSLKDKTGKEIYEFDVIHVEEDHGMVKSGYYIVAYYNACFMITKDSDLNYMEHYLWFIADKCKVIKSFFESREEWTRLQVKSIKRQNNFY